MSTNVYAKFRFAALCIKKALRIFRELIKTRTRTRTTRVAFWDPPSGSKNDPALYEKATSRMNKWHASSINSTVGRPERGRGSHVTLLKVLTDEPIYQYQLPVPLNWYR